MKRFAKYIVLYFGLPMLLVVLFYNTKASLFLNKAQEVYQLVDFVEHGTITTKTLLLGDSVCRQFFENQKNDSVYCLCQNQAYEVPGNFLLLKKILEKHNDIGRVVLVINPRSLVAALNQKYTYNYFIQPFRPLLDSLDVAELRYIEECFPSGYPFRYRFSYYNLPDAIDIFAPQQIKKWEVSERNQRYLEKLRILCKENEVAFELLAPPLPNSNQKYLNRFSQKDKNRYASYFNSIIYYDSVQSEDGLHHKDPMFLLAQDKRIEKTILGN